MDSVHDMEERWRRLGHVAVRRGARYIVVATSQDAPEPPSWSVCRIMLSPRCILHVDDASAILDANSSRSDAVRVMRVPGDRIIVRRDALGRSLMVGTAWSGGVAVGNDPKWMLATSSSGTHVCQARLTTHRHGLDRFDTSIEDFFEGLWRVPPGHLCQLGRSDFKLESWWAEEVRDDHDAREHEQRAEALIRRLDDAIGFTTADALAVSSGLDSTLLAARCHRHGQQVRLGSMSFPGLPACDESARIHAWNKTMGVPLSELFDMTEVSAFGAEDAHLEHLAWFGPQGHPGERYERVFTHRFASRHDLDELMTGVGADQLFEVDPWHVIDELLARHAWDELAAPHWQTMIGMRGIARTWSSRRAGAFWRAHAPKQARTARLATQLFGAARALAPWQESLVASLLEPDLTWGAREDLIARRRMLSSWEWEGLMRALWRLEQASGVRIETPFLHEPLWRWGVWLMPSKRLDGFGGALYNKFLLREAHGHHADLFPEGFARRGKAAVFDAHIRRGMMGPDREVIEDVLEHILDDLAHERAHMLWSRVSSGATGRPLVELCRIFTAERWRQNLDLESTP